MQSFQRQLQFFNRPALFLSKRSPIGARLIKTTNIIISGVGVLWCSFFSVIGYDDLYFRGRISFAKEERKCLVSFGNISFYFGKD